MHHEEVIWAFDDMDAARRLWPRVKTLIEQQVANREIDLNLADQRRLTAAVVNELLENAASDKRNWCTPKAIERLLGFLRKPNGDMAQDRYASAQLFHSIHSS